MEDTSNSNPYLLTVIRNAVDNETMKSIYQLVNSDYNLFEPTRPDVLYLDFATVGKDLMNCLYSNDVELVKNKKVKPQEYVMPYIRYTFSKAGKQNNQYYENWKRAYMKDLELWITNNKLEKYIDYKLPKYNTGRIKLGEISDNIGFEHIINIKNNYPYIWGVYIEE